jgi:uncharacterized protein YcbK (DUF882 family)
MNIEDIMPPDWQQWNYTTASFDPAILAIYAEALRLFPGAWVNVFEGKRKLDWAGLRSPNCRIGAPQSAHKLGKALDFHHPAKLKEMREWAFSPEGLAIGIRRIERAADTPGWLHADTIEPNPARWQDKTRPYVFKP